MIVDDENCVLVFRTDLDLSDLALLEIIISLDGDEVAVVDFGCGEP